MLEDLLEIKTVNDKKVYFRKPGRQVPYKPVELEKMVKYLTNEDFEDFEGKKFKRRVINPENFEIYERYPKPSELIDSDDETDNYTCICSEDSCEHLVIIRHKPTDIYMAIGSVCYTRFNEGNISQLYLLHHAQKCNNCKVPLVFQKRKYIPNTNQKCDGKCFDCFELTKKCINKKVYLNVSYADKDNAKSMGAWWDADKKKWYAPNGSSKYEKLIEKYH
jgi:hypothetical protein